MKKVMFFVALMVTFCLGANAQSLKDALKQDAKATATYAKAKANARVNEAKTKE